jgi:hypothetical protein
MEGDALTDGHRETQKDKPRGRQTKIHTHAERKRNIQGGSLYTDPYTRRYRNRQRKWETLSHIEGVGITTGVDKIRLNLLNHLPATPFLPIAVRLS